MSGKISVVVRAIIRNTPTSVAPGQKSSHEVVIDTSSKKIEVKDPLIGTTLGLKGIRNKFVLQNQCYGKESVEFSLVGQTATAVGVLPNINYQLKFILYPSLDMITVYGSHDGYPSYTVDVNGVNVYDFQQGFVPALWGDSDIKVFKSNVCYV